MDTIHLNFIGGGIGSLDFTAVSLDFNSNFNHYRSAMHSNSQLVVSCHLRFQLFITFERYCTAKSAKVKLREKHRNSLHFRGCQKTICVLLFPRRISTEICCGFCYFLLYILLFIIFVIHIFPLQGLDFDTAKKVRF